MQLDDRQIEQYSRQIILPEVGPEGQTRLLRASVGVTACGPAADRVVAYLAAAGVGRLALPTELHHHVDVDGDTTILPEAEHAEGGALDTVVLCGDDAAAAASGWRGVPHVFWIADGVAAEVPPCIRCFRTTSTALASPSPDLAAIRDAFLGTVVATEVVKALLGIGDPLRGRVLTYDPDRAVVTAQTVTARPDCPVCRDRV